MVGLTDYSHQSLTDISIDLEEWNNSLEESVKVINKISAELIQNGYWKQVDFDFRSICAYAVKFFDTAKSDIREVIEGIHTEIKEYHFKILIKLATTAQEIFSDAKKVWSSYRDKEYGEANFSKVESIDSEICNMAGDMFDLDNLAHRIKDFIGRKVVDMDNGARVNNIFQGSVTGFQQNLDNSTGIQNIGNSNVDIEELRSIITEIKELLGSVPNEEKDEIVESLNDLEETIESDIPKKSKIKAFGALVLSGLKKLFTLETFAKVETLSTKLPQVTENFEKVLDKIFKN
ncbi:hypothetical protein [Paenibacillus sp. 22594]|uniref:hypothetical protein n=1 Tax=Paenibacillus sp. 22594 TaxID=3453947 RepID=UPI003F87DD59